MDKFFDPINIRGGVNFPALPTTYGDDLSYLETVSRLCRMVNDLIEQCNLNTEDKMKLENLTPDIDITHIKVMQPDIN